MDLNHLCVNGNTLDYYRQSQAFLWEGWQKVRCRTGPVLGQRAKAARKDMGPSNHSKTTSRPYTTLEENWRISVSKIGKIWMSGACCWGFTGVQGHTRRGRGRFPYSTTAVLGWEEGGQKRVAASAWGGSHGLSRDIPLKLNDLYA